MSRVFLYFLIILILALITFALREKLGKKTKPFFGILLVIFIVLAVFFEFENTQKSHLRTDIIVAFNQNKNILCKDINVSKRILIMNLVQEVLFQRIIIKVLIL